MPIHGQTESTQEIPTTAWMLRRLAGASNQTMDDRSFTLGLAGLAVLSTLTAASLPVQVDVVNKYAGQPPFVGMLAVLQTLIYPTIIVFAFAIVASLFRGGSLTKNLLLSLAIALPGWIAFFVVGLLVFGKPYGDEFTRLLEMIVGFYLGAAFVATSFQIWTRWTLSSLNLSNNVVARPGIASLLELTAIYAVVCAIGMSIDTTDTVVAIALSFGFGCLAAIAIITCLVGFLSKPNQRTGKLLSICGALAASSVFCAVMTEANSGWSLSGTNLVLVAVVSLYGALLILLMMSICLLWLSACGWQCVK